MFILCLPYFITTVTKIDIVTRSIFQVSRISKVPNNRAANLIFTLGKSIKDVPFFCHFLRYLPTHVPFSPIISYIPKIGHPTLANISTSLFPLKKSASGTFAYVFNVILTGKEAHVYHKSHGNS